MVFLLGRFFALSTTATRVPMTGPSTDKSAKMPDVWPPLRAKLLAVAVILGWGYGGCRPVREALSCGLSSVLVNLPQDSVFVSFRDGV